MNAVTLKDAKLNLEQLVEQVIADAEATIVVTKSGDRVVVLPLDEYNSWKETLYLLSNPANADHLRRSIAEAQAASGPPSKVSASQSPSKPTWRATGPAGSPTSIA
jgi:antitoxin YefM